MLSVMHYSLALILPSLRKCVRTAIKNMVREKKNQKVLACYIWRRDRSRTQQR